MSDADPRGNGSAAPHNDADESRNLPNNPDDDKIVISKFWKSRSKREHVVAFKWNGLPLVHLRVFDDASGCSRPSKKGVSLTVHKLPELLSALQRANDKAEALGWFKAR
jgi:hypothetical protein